MNVQYSSPSRRALIFFLVLLLGLATLIGGLGGFVSPDGGAIPQVSAMEDVTISGPAADDQGSPGSWQCENRPWLTGERFGISSPASSSLGQALPADYFATVAAIVPSRYFHLTLYSPAYGDLVLDVPFGSIERETGDGFPTGRLDPVGVPSLSYNGQIKIVTALSGGSKGAGDRGWRIYTWCRIVPESTGAGIVTLSEGNAFAATAAPVGKVDIYEGEEFPGLERDACGFKDGIYVMHAQIINRVVIVRDPLKREYYRSLPLGPAFDGYNVNTIDCLRSSQSGKLIMVTGGFYVGGGGQKTLTLSTDYPIAQEVVYQGTP